MLRLFKRRRTVQAEEVEVPMVRLFEEPIQEDIPEAFDFELEMSVGPRKIAAIFMDQGWQLAVGDTIGIPLPYGIAQFIAEQSAALLESPEAAAYAPIGRMLFLKDDVDFPDSVDIYLHLGTAARVHTDETEETL
ncbi:hypothetical protein O7635_29405 [Asanoa sp. WMMD1127]|uniref:hypothetical protein n=1 Tax=Asanoa sp. WMMD1127 TaxID=3016107 RepID=UPI0024179E53|nr:hypothetical protein [Asanoa sp. WMMD1127]MDG4825986.1 hypothetical protein [Asanoa sp. WMMD1127]